MDTELASRDERLAVIARQQATIVQLQATVATLEARVHEPEHPLTLGGPRGMPGPKSQDAAPSDLQRPQKQRQQHFARRRQAPMWQVVHAVAACPACEMVVVGGPFRSVQQLRTPG